jgi:archaemetzincin
VIQPAIAPPRRAFRPERGQYDADVILDVLFDRLDATTLRIVGVTETDLFAEGRNFVFGYAHMRDRVATFSTLRLREGDAERYGSRIDKALTHELGHTFHAPHCPRPRCVMHQVEFLWQLDDLSPDYCDLCRHKVHATLSRGTDDPLTWFELAGSYMRRRRFARAAAAYTAAVERDPGNAHYANDLGVALLALGDKAGAARAFRRAQLLAPELPHAYYNLGIVCRETGDRRAADRCFRQAIEREKDRCSAYRYLGMLHHDYFRDVVRARAYLERYRSLGGDDPDALRRLNGLSSLDASNLVTESTAPV